jgi:hypothetical protein
MDNPESALYCQSLWIVHSCVPYIASLSGLSILVCPILPVSLDCPFLCALYCQSLWIVHSCVPYIASLSGLSTLVCPILPVSLDCPFLCALYCQSLWIVHSCVPYIASLSGLSILVCPMYTQEWTIQRDWQYRAHKSGQSRETGNIGHTRVDKPERLAI